jgi:hypothetical protein
MALVSHIPKSLKFAGLTAWTAWSDRASKRGKPSFDGCEKKLRIVLVKSSDCRELYSKATPCKAAELLASSTWRSGPFGLFTQLDADFIIVRPSTSPECNVYERRDKNYPNTQRLRALCRESQDAVAVNSTTVDWSKYDVVIAYDNAIPSNIAQRYPTVFWATIHEDHRMISYAQNRNKLPVGYDAFLNLRLGPSPHDWRRRQWEIDFSYGFKGLGGFSNLFDTVQKKNQICVEDHHTNFDCEVAQKRLSVPVSRPLATGLMDYLCKVKSAKVFWIPEPDRPLGGLAALDAAALGCVVVANRNRIWNAHTILPELHCKGWIEGAQLVERLLVDNEYFASCLNAQSILLNYYNFRRPLGQLYAAIINTPRELSAKICM